MLELDFEATLLEKGFYLYVWEVTRKRGKPYLYVGMTGDTGSGVAQSPFARVSAHLGNNERNNTLRRYLRDKNLNPEDCQRFRLLAFKVFDSAKGTEEYRERRAKVAALEKRLRDELNSLPGFEVLNQVVSRQELDPKWWKKVRAAFATRYPINDVPPQRRSG